MKKMIISVMALAVSMMAMATESAYVRMRLTGESGASSVVRITKDDARTKDFEDGYDTDKMMSYANSRSVLLYGLVGTHKCEDVVTNSLTNQFIGFATNQLDQNYTLSFESFEGESFELYDLVADKHFTVNGSTPAYNFSVEAAQVGRKEIDKRFIINYTPADELEACFIDNKLQINANPYEEQNIVIKDKDGNNITGSPFAPEFPSQVIDLSTIGAAGDRFTVEFANGARKFVIVKQ